LFTDLTGFFGASNYFFWVRLGSTWFESRMRGRAESKKQKAEMRTVQGHMNAQAEMLVIFGFSSFHLLALCFRRRAIEIIDPIYIYGVEK